MSSTRSCIYPKNITCMVNQNILWIIVFLRFKRLIRKCKTPPETYTRQQMKNVLNYWKQRAYSSVGKALHHVFPFVIWQKLLLNSLQMLSPKAYTADNAYFYFINFFYITLILISQLDFVCFPNNLTSFNSPPPSINRVNFRVLLDWLRGFTFKMARCNHKF